MPFDFVELHQRIVSAEIKPDCFICIVIPIRNEAKNIALTLASLARQTDSGVFPLEPNSFEIIVLANNCADDSAEIVEAWRKKHPHITLHLAVCDLPPEKANIGYVRRWLMNEAYLRLARSRFKTGVIMTTDGDTCAAPNWIAANLREIRNGADAVGGRILIKSEKTCWMNHKARRFHLLDTGYRLLAAELEARLDYVAHDHLPRHHQHFNASFAVTTEAFRRAGGIPRVRFLEDVAFFQSLVRVDARVRHSPLVRVQTSSRYNGRTELGLSTQIKEWTLMGAKGADYLVEDARVIEKRTNLRRMLRRTWESERRDFRLTERLSGELMIPTSFLAGELETAQTFGSLLEKVHCAQAANGEWKKTFPLVTVEKAIYDLRRLLQVLR